VGRNFHLVIPSGEEVTMFLVLIHYTRPLEEVEKVRASHRSFLDECVATGHLVVSGPRKPKTGGVLLVRGSSLEEVKAIFAKDPFHVAGVASYEFVEFDPVKHAPGFERFLTSPGQ
jgi:uncharacterized protein YciI